MTGRPGESSSASIDATGEIDPARRNSLDTFQKDSKIRFRDLRFLNLSFIHRSCLNESPLHSISNERLEFLGDAVLGMLVAALLYRSFPEKTEGDLARMKSILVSEETLATRAAELGVDRLLVLGRGEERSGGRQKRALVANALEAVIGALYIDSGIDAAAAFVEHLSVPEIERIRKGLHRKDFKTIIQQYAQKCRYTPPVYVIEGGSGPEHDRTFLVSCTMGGRTFAAAEGKSKKEAEKAAAAKAFDCIIEEGGVEADRLEQLCSC